MNIAIIGYDLRALSLARILIKEKNHVYVIPGFNKDYFRNLTSFNIDHNCAYSYEVVRELDKIYFILKKLSPDLIINLHVESSDEGISEYLRKKNLKVFGCNKSGAKIEVSKFHGLEFANYSNLTIPNTIFIKKLEKNNFSLERFNKKDFKKLVLKANGLAGGKGTFIIENYNKLIECFKDIDDDILIQEYIEGEEVSISFLLNNKSFEILNINFEIKKEFDGDLGNNTSGMGTVSRNAFDLNNLDIKKYFESLIKSLKDISYNGALDINFIIRDNKIYFLEFTSRFGDPELQSELLLINNITNVFYKNANFEHFSLDYLPIKWATGIVANSNNKKELLVSGIHKKNYLIDSLIIDEKTTFSISSYGNDYNKLFKNSYLIMDKVLDISFHYRKDLNKTIEKRWQKFNKLF